MKIAQLEELTAGPGFWNDPRQAQQVMRELTRLREQAVIWDRLSHQIEDALLLSGLDDAEMEAELTHEVERLQEEVNKLEFQTLFSGRYDDRDAIFAIHAGTAARRPRIGR